MQDPFAFLVGSVRQTVQVHTINDDLVTGTLVGVDEHGNVLLDRWQIEEGNASSAEPPLKRTRHDSNAFLARRSVRFIRGAQIKHITLPLVAGGES